MAEDLPPSYMMALPLRRDLPLLAARTRQSDSIHNQPHGRRAVATRAAGGPWARFGGRLRAEPPRILSARDAAALATAPGTAGSRRDFGRPTGGPYRAESVGDGRILSGAGLDGGDVFECAENQRCKDLAEQVRLLR